MHGTRTTVRIEAGREDEARRGLADQVIPRVKAAPGFVAGYWFAEIGDQGWSLVIWEAREQAEAMAAQLSPGSHPAPAVTVEKSEVFEVVGSA